MPPLPPTPSGVVAIDLRMTAGSDANINSKLHMRYTGGPPTQADLNTLCNDVHASWVTNLKAWVQNGEVLNEVIATDLASLSGAQGIWAGSEAGSRNGGALPANVCVLANAKIARRYRGGRPRLYLRALTSGDLTGPQLWGGTIIGNFATAWTTFVASLIAAHGAFTITAACSVSYYLGGTWHDESGTGAGPFKRVATPRAVPVIDNILQWSASPIPASQRRRLGR